MTQAMLDSRGNKIRTFPAKTETRGKAASPYIGAEAVFWRENDRHVTSKQSSLTWAHQIGHNYLNFSPIFTIKSVLEIRERA